MVSCAAGFSEPSGSLKPSCSGGSHLRPFDRTPSSTAPSPIGSDRNGTGSSRRRAPPSTWAHVHSLATHPRRFPHACRLLTLAPSRAAGLAGASLARALAVCSVSPASIATAHSSPSARRCSRPPVQPAGGPLRAAAVEVRRHRRWRQAEESSDVGRRAAGVAYEPGSGRLGRAGPACSLAGGRPKRGGLCLSACLAIARCVVPASPPGTRAVESGHGESSQSLCRCERCAE